MSEKCGAKTRSGKPCKKDPIKGRSRCKLHGGKTKIKHGLYFSDVRAGLMDAIERARSDPRLDHSSGTPRVHRRRLPAGRRRGGHLVKVRQPGVKRLPGGGFCYEITTQYDPETGKGRLVTPDSGSLRITPFGPGHHQDDEHDAPNE